VSEGNALRSYRDLRVWSVAVDLAVDCYRTTKSFPANEAYGMTSQIRRSAASIAANIAEGYGRDGPGQFQQFLKIAQGSLKELETHLIISARVGLMAEQESYRLLGQCEDVGKMLGGLIRKAVARF